MAKNFNNFDSELNKMIAAAERGMEKAVIKLEADTKLLTHVQTGALRRSWTHDVKTDGSVVEGAVGSNLEYAPHEDDRHGNLSTALNENLQQYLNTIANEIKMG